MLSIYGVGCSHCRVRYINSLHGNVRSATMNIVETLQI